jgi:hypothetical protein
MRSPVSKQGIGESKAIKSRESSHSELTFPSILETEFVNKRAIVAVLPGRRRVSFPLSSP